MYVQSTACVQKDPGAGCAKISSGYPRWKRYAWLRSSLKMHTSSLNLQAADGRHIPALPPSDSYRDLIIGKERPELQCTTWLLLTHRLLCLSSHFCTAKFPNHLQFAPCVCRRGVKNLRMPNKNTLLLLHKNTLFCLSLRWPLQLSHLSVNTHCSM